MYRAVHVPGVHRPLCFGEKNGGEDVHHPAFGHRRGSAANSLFIILISQIAGTTEMVLRQTIPSVHTLYFVLMIFGGVLGATLGRRFNRKLDNAKVTRLFEILMIIIMGINVFYIVKFI